MSLLNFEVEYLLSRQVPMVLITHLAESNSSYELVEYIAKHHQKASKEDWTKVIDYVGHGHSLKGALLAFEIS